MGSDAASVRQVMGKGIASIELGKMAHWLAAAQRDLPVIFEAAAAAKHAPLIATIVVDMNELEEWALAGDSVTDMSRKMVVLEVLGSEGREGAANAAAIVKGARSMGMQVGQCPSTRSMLPFRLEHARRACTSMLSPLQICLSQEFRRSGTDAVAPSKRPKLACWDASRMRAEVQQTLTAYKRLF